MKRYYSGSTVSIDGEAICAEEGAAEPVAHGKRYVLATGMAGSAKGEAKPGMLTQNVGAAPLYQSLRTVTWSPAAIIACAAYWPTSTSSPKR